MALNPSQVGLKSEPFHFAYDWKTVALYALGIGATKDELDYLYEGRGPRVYPTFAVCTVMPAVQECLGKTGGDFATVVHGAQSIKFFAPIPPSGELTTTATLTGIYDMKKLAQVVVSTRTELAGQGPIFETAWSILYRGAGGFGGQRPPKSDAVELPKDRPADFHLEMTTHREQALLYRLSGDLNPLHADPEFAASVGFPQGPILHGLCTYGFVGRAVARSVCGGDASRIVQLDGQFRRPVWPGDTIVVDGFRVESEVESQDVGLTTVALAVSVKERPDAVMTGTFAKVRSAQ